MALAVAADLAVYVCHGWRWSTLLSPVLQLKFWRTVQAIYIGLFANEVLPFRPGELIRCYLLAHWNDLRVSLGFASAAVERIIDGFWLLAAFLVTATFARGMPSQITLLVRGLGVALLIASIVFFWVPAGATKHVHATLEESRWSATFRHVIEGLRLMGNPRTLAAHLRRQPDLLRPAGSDYVRADEAFWARLFLLGCRRRAGDRAARHADSERAR